MSNDRGIYQKFKVTRTDGSSTAGGKHNGCPYFVLDLRHDPFAFPALKAYATACRASHPELARDIDTIIDEWAHGTQLSAAAKADALISRTTPPPGAKGAP